MSPVSGFIASANAAAASLTTQLAQLQFDLTATGDVDNATTAQLATLSADAAAALGSAQQALAAHESVLAYVNAGNSLVSGANPSAAANAVLLMLNATAGMALAQDTANRMVRIGKTIANVGT